MSDLIERLRTACSLPTGLYGEAADELERLQRENEQLRKELADKIHLLAESSADIAALKASTEPVAWMTRVIGSAGQHLGDLFSSRYSEGYVPLYLHPPKQASTEQWNETMRQKKAWADGKDAEPVAVIKRNESGQITMQAPDGNHFDMSKYVGATLYTTPPTATALLESLGDWVHERMQQADADYHNYGDDTAEVYATLKMVLSKIESMIEGEDHGRHE